MHRTVEGIGTAYYLPHEERFVHALLGGDSPTRFQEVEVIHALKVELDACLLPQDRPEPEYEQTRLA